MSEETLANKSQPPSAMPDAEYDIIHATVSETAQGRRFLEEYARRCRPAEPDASLAAIERMRMAVREDTGDRLDLLLEMADMAQAIAHLRAEILAMKPPPGAGPLDATEELDSIVNTTEGATSRILAAAEQVQEIAWTMRESGSIEALCDELDMQATEIYTACSFQDLTGQRTRKVIQVLHYLEDRINATVSAQEKATADDLRSTGKLLQAGVDAQPPTLTQEERQDATLEDISRLMLAIEPMIGLQQPEEPVEEPDANIIQTVEEVRPELSVAETVMAEADTAREMAEWKVEPAAPVQSTPAAEETAPMADWVVEDPQAPQPESEPAWMILRRMEAELDAELEAEAKAAPAFSPAPPIPPAPAVPVMAEPVVPSATEPGLFVAEAMSQLEQSLRPASLLPPAELTFRTKFSHADPLAELETAMAAAEMNLLQPGEDAEMLQAAATSALMKRAAATVTEARAPAVALIEEPPVEAAEADLDDFLFADPPATANSAFEPPAQAAAQEAGRQEARLEEMASAAAPEWEGGTYPDPALVTPETLPPPEAEQPESRASYDPLAPLRALSDAQKIALFS